MGAVIKAAWAVHLVHVSGLCRGRARAVRVPSAAARPDRRSVPCWRHSWWGRRGLVEALRGTAVRGGHLPGPRSVSWSSWWPRMRTPNAPRRA